MKDGGKWWTVEEVAAAAGVSVEEVLEDIAAKRLTDFMSTGYSPRVRPADGRAYAGRKGRERLLTPVDRLDAMIHSRLRSGLDCSVPHMALIEAYRAMRPAREMDLAWMAENMAGRLGATVIWREEPVDVVFSKAE